MKPIKLVLSGYGPYASVVEIPFDVLGGQGIFLITGDTGAGKTTIFDGITYALFGHVSGSIRTTGTIRSDFAKAETDTFAELYFSHKDQLYRIRRSPEYKRLKKRGEGTTTRAAECELHLPSGSVITKQREVDSAVEELLGVNYKQWMQISMIAQGEFQKLLNADSKTRGEIFRKVFHTDRLLWIQMELSKNLSDVKRKWESGRNRILQHMTELLCQENSDAGNELKEILQEENVHQVQRWLALAAEILRTDEEVEKNLVGQQAVQAANITELQKRKVLAEHINSLLKQLEQAKSTLHAMEQSAVEMDRLEERTIYQRKALYDVFPMDKERQEAKQQQEDCKRRKVEVQAKIEAHTSLLQQLMEAEREAKKSQPLIDQLTIQLVEEKQNSKQYDLAEDKNAEISALSSKIRQCQELEREHIERLESLMLEYAQLERIPEQLQQARIDQERNTTHIQELERKAEYLQQQEKIWLRYKDSKGKWQRDVQDYDALEKKRMFADREYQKKEMAYWRNQAGILALALDEGQPCPVCGSQRHPQKAIMEQEICSKEQLDEQKKQLECLHEVLQEKSRQLAMEKRTMQELEEQLSVIDFFCESLDDELCSKEESQGWTTFDRTLHREITATQQSLQLAKRQHQMYSLSIEKWDKQQNRLHELASLREQMIQTMQESQLQIGGLQARYKAQQDAYWELTSQLKFASKAAADQEIEKMEQEKSNMEKYMQQCIVELQQGHSHLAYLQAQLDEQNCLFPALEQRVVEKQEAFIRVMQASGIKDEASYQELLTDSPTIEKQNTTVTQYRAEQAQLQGNIDYLAKQVDGKSVENVAEIDIQLHELTVEMECLASQMKAIAVRIAQNLSLKEKVEKIVKENSKIEKEYMMMKELSDTANGVLAGRPKIAFEQYVQAKYFDEVLEQANHRLAVMSNQRYSLIKRDFAMDLRSQSGLDLDVHDCYTGKTRPVKSLSGGESFQASLSLALGMSDVMQHTLGGIQMDTLFIDEGFGSLDPDAMEQAIQVLRNLSEGNRLIGIISHVNELKESIPKRIIVTAQKGSNSGKGSVVQLEV